MTPPNQEIAPINMLQAFESAAPDPNAAPWLRRHKLGIATTVAGAATVGMLIGQPFAETIEQFKDAGIWAGAGVVGGEAGFIGGAALMVAAAGQRVGNPLHLRDRVRDLPGHLVHNPLFKAGFFVNAVGSVMTSATITAGIATEVPQAWPLAAVAVADVAATITTRKVIWGGLREEGGKVSPGRRLITRAATLEDVDRIADHDLRMFGSAYGENLPTKDESANMMRQRLGNIAMGGGWALVQEYEKKEDEEPGQIVGFMTAFRTNKSPEEFSSWEDCTNNGTLNGSIDAHGDNVYICNIGSDPGGCREQMEGRMLGNITASDAKGRIFFESRMPNFQPWLKRQLRGGETTVDQLSTEQMTQYATEYRDATRTDKKGRPVPYDTMLRMYVKAGARLGNVLPDAFQDERSLNYGVVCDMDIPIVNAPRSIRRGLGGIIKLASRSQRLMKKVF